MGFATAQGLSRAALLAVLFSSAVARAGGAVPSWTLTYAEKPERRLEVEASFPEGPAREWTASEAESAGRFVGHLHVTLASGEARTVAFEDGSWKVPAGATRIRYACTLKDGAWDGSMLEGDGSGARVNAESCLLYPDDLDRDVDATFEVHAPKGFSVLSPFHADAKGLLHTTRYGLANPGYLTFTPLPLWTVSAGRRTLEVARLPGKLDASGELVKGWLVQAVREVASFCGGEFPPERTAVTLVPVGGTDASPFGEILHSPDPSVSILVGRNAGAEAFRADWIAVHELTHLAHPAIQPPTPWITEGLATWYTEILRGRSGRLTEPEVWANLVDGFKRGRLFSKGATLEEASATMGKTRDYLRVYWGGAAFFLAADVAIRERSKGTRSLDDVVAALRDGGRFASLDDLAKAIDKAAGAPVSKTLLERHVKDGAFAALPPLLQSLGVRTAKSPESLDDSAPKAAVRKALLRPKEASVGR